MKKKFVLTLALALIVAASLVAAPVTLAGSFKAGYKMVFDDGLTTSATGDELSIDALSLSADFWSLSFSDIAFDADNAAKLSIYLDKALAEQGVDMGDISLTYQIGNMGDLTPSYVYADSVGDIDDYYKLKMAGAAYSSALTVGYGSMLSVYVGADLATTAATMPVVGSVKVMPVDGVSATVAYTNVASIYDFVADARVTSAKGAFAASACVDVAKLAGLDFGLKASAYDVYYMDAEVNNLFAEVSASYDMVSAWVEYRLLDGDSDITAKAKVALLDNVSVYAKGASLLNDATYTVGGSANYVMGGVTYNCDVDFNITDVALTVTPTVKVSF